MTLIDRTKVRHQHTLSTIKSRTLRVALLQHPLQLLHFLLLLLVPFYERWKGNDFRIGTLPIEIPPLIESNKNIQNAIMRLRRPPLQVALGPVHAVPLEITIFFICSFVMVVWCGAIHLSKYLKPWHDHLSVGASQQCWEDTYIPFHVYKIRRSLLSVETGSPAPRLHNLIQPFVVVLSSSSSNEQ